MAKFVHTFFVAKVFATKKSKQWPRQNCTRLEAKRARPIGHKSSQFRRFYSHIDNLKYSQSSNDTCIMNILYQIFSVALSSLSNLVQAIAGLVNSILTLAILCRPISRRAEFLCLINQALLQIHEPLICLIYTGITQFRKLFCQLNRFVNV